ncbi:DUF3177 family protein [Salisaeta longa]|uniref:DUF3177 family protein n=1 Tax=Salisaeta longa TaxID=503170 RepID=UPI0003B47F53|nr:DUF3177 family protein [Salisaeta longa]
MTLYELLIRVDFVLAVGLLVIAPLILLGLSLRQRGLRGRMLVYWRASALLGITVYFWADAEPIGFATGYLARLLIPLALWRGDVFFAIRMHGPLTGDTARVRSFKAWQYVAIVYNLMGLVYMLPLWQCVVGEDGLRLCQAWYGPAQQYAAWVHPTLDSMWLARYAWFALGLYALYLLASGLRFQRLRARQRV